ncbi:MULTISPECIES: PEP/pyruvate-binding domain-containing protein [unclassified Nocardia]|uniref:PEP/pyruvate-binding domain-containing protein n=1 Tax=unclassified Nocardia TaxID=2637762 RepID=UPI00278C4941|nr:MULTISPECIES: PEP/pyruvate-binding domain-containing protein [unclassified Nocardia]
MTAAELAAVADATAAARLDPALIGHKAANLAWLHRHGYRVPAFCVLTTAACARILEPVRDELDALLGALDAEDPKSLRDTADAIAELVTALSLPDDLAADLHRRLTELEGAGRLAVRSSARGEDSAIDSFAGQLDTLLNVAPEAVPDAVLACLASAYSQRALFYRVRRGLGNAIADTAVIVQTLVDSATAGVVFSCNPRNGDPGEAVVSAGLGLGEGVVSGTVDCDTYFVDTRSRTVTARSIGEKSSAVLPTADGTAVTAVPPVDAPALTDAQVLELTGLAVELAERLDAPQDVEWAIDRAGRIHLLQTRPVTATGAQETIFDNVNVAESYPGVSSPLTFSIVRLAYEQVFRVCHRDFGARRATVRAGAADLYPYLVGTWHGRIYYNISNWYRLFLRIPGLDFAIEGWEAALGIENRYRRPAPPAGAWARARTLLLRARVVLILLLGWFRLPRRLAHFFTELDRFRADLDHRLDPATPDRERTPHALLTWLDRVISDLVPAYAVQIFNDFIAQQLFHALGKLLQDSGVDNPDTLRNELFCGEEGVDSVEPVRSALALATRAAADPALRALIDSDRDPARVWAELHDDAHTEFLAAYRAHLAAYGDRTVDELKLETDSLEQHPEKLIPVLRNYIRRDIDFRTMTAEERRIRREAEVRLRRALRGRPLRWLLVRLVLAQARATVKQRENMRLGRSRCFGMVKRVFRVLGTQLHEAGLLDEPRDVFYLTYEEIAALTRGTSVTAQPRDLVAARTRDHEIWRAQAAPSRIVTAGIAAAHTPEPEFLAFDDAAVLTGIGCAPGRVQAPALVLPEPDTAAVTDGRVLVAATTDPGWVFLMVAAGGLVSEKGSLLSHTAIIGRELGIPTVVGVPQATRRIADGDTVMLDGHAGTVTLIARKGSA